MIKIIFCLRRRPDLTREAFHSYWLGTHAPLVRELAPSLRIRRYVQSHTLDDPRLASAIAARGGLQAPYDGVAELWWDSVEDVLAVGNTAEGRASGRLLLADERNFIDLPNSPLFYAREHAIVGTAS